LKKKSHTLINMKVSVIQRRKSGEKRSRNAYLSFEEGSRAKSILLSIKEAGKSCESRRFVLAPSEKRPKARGVEAKARGVRGLRRASPKRRKRKETEQRGIKTKRAESSRRKIDRVEGSRESERKTANARREKRIEA